MNHRMKQSRILLGGKKPTRLKVLSFGHLMRRQGCFEKSITPEKVEGKRKGRPAAKWMDSIYHFIILIAKSKADCWTFCPHFGLQLLTASSVVCPPDLGCNIRTSARGQLRNAAGNSKRLRGAGVCLRGGRRQGCSRLPSANQALRRGASYEWKPSGEWAADGEENRGSAPGEWRENVGG